MLQDYAQSRGLHLEGIRTFEEIEADRKARRLEARAARTGPQASQANQELPFPMVAAQSVQVVHAH